MKVILGKKLEMTQRYTEKGVAPVTVVEAGPCTVTQIKDKKEGYQAIQIGFSERRKKNNQSILGHLKGLINFRYLREFRGEFDVKRGQVCTVESFKPGDRVAVTGTSKGKGFQGVVKRHGFHGSPASHGHKDQLRMPGSIGSTGPQKVFKGVRMPGRMGNDQVTTPNLEIVDVDPDHNLLYIRGAVPGGRNGLLQIVAKGDMVFTDTAKKEEKSEPKKEIVEEKKPEVKSDSPVIEKKEEPKAEVKEEPKKEEKKESKEEPVKEEK